MQPKFSGDLIARMSQERLMATGEYEVSGFHAVDSAFASYISRIFDGARVNTPSAATAEYVKYIEKKPADRVVVGKFDSTVEFLRMLRKDKGRSTRPAVNNDALPVINVSRSADVVFSSSDYKIDQRSGDSLELVRDTDGVAFAAINRSQAALTYTVTILTFNKETLSLIQSAIAMVMRFSPRRSFSVKTHIARAEIEQDFTLTDSRDQIWSDLSESVSENRLFAASITLSLNADVIYALAVEARTENYTISSFMGSPYRGVGNGY